MSPIFCQRCQDLFGDYNEATESFKDVMRKLRDVGLSGEMDAYNELWQQAMAASQQCRYAQEFLKMHLQSSHKD